MSPLKPIKKLLNYKMMKFLVNRLSNLYYLFTRCAIFQVWFIKQIFLFSFSAYYRADWINNAAIIVCMCWYGCQCVRVCVCVGMDVSVCVCVLSER